MKSQALQEFVKKVFSDEQTKKQFISNPESVISQFSLTEEEKRAVLSTHAKIGLVGSDSGQFQAIILPFSGWF